MGENHNDMTELLTYSRESADDLDRATAVEAAAVMGGVSDVLARMQGAGQDWCEDCGEDMPAERRAKVPYAIRCMPCQALHERKTQGVRRG